MLAEHPTLSLTKPVRPKNPYNPRLVEPAIVTLGLLIISVICYTLIDQAHRQSDQSGPTAIFLGLLIPISASAISAIIVAAIKQIHRLPTTVKWHQYHQETVRYREELRVAQQEFLAATNADLQAREHPVVNETLLLASDSRYSQPSRVIARFEYVSGNDSRVYSTLFDNTRIERRRGDGPSLRFPEARYRSIWLSDDGHFTTVGPDGAEDVDLGRRAILTSPEYDIRLRSNSLHDSRAQWPNH